MSDTLWKRPLAASAKARSRVETSDPWLHCIALVAQALPPAPLPCENWNRLDYSRISGQPSTASSKVVAPTGQPQAMPSACGRPLGFGMP
jgi:hypothetical protein